MIPSPRTIIQITYLYVLKTGYMKYLFLKLQFVMQIIPNNTNK